jgi:hypothetical protein
LPSPRQNSRSGFALEVESDSGLRFIGSAPSSLNPQAWR